MFDSQTKRNSLCSRRYAKDLKPLVQALIAARADRVVWGSNWPHPIRDGFMPNDGDLLDLLCDWVPDAATLKRILVANPAQLYGFD